MRMQEKTAIDYAWRKLKFYGKNYPTHDIIDGGSGVAFKISMHYFYGTQFHMFSDHKSLRTYLLIKS